MNVRWRWMGREATATSQVSFYGTSNDRDVSRAVASQLLMYHYLFGSLGWDIILYYCTLSYGERWCCKRLRDLSEL